MEDEKQEKKPASMEEDGFMCTSDVRGKRIVHPSPMNFSFYFFAKQGVYHDPTVKPLFNPNKLRTSQTGTLKLCGDWEYLPGPDDKAVSDAEIDQMKRFFKDNIVLFCLVWERHLTDPVVEDYLQGYAEFEEVIQDLDFYAAHQAELDRITTVPELEKFCRDNHLVNFYGN